jgi:hypothetical protein
MSEHQQERQSVAPARADAGRSRWRSWFASTGAPPAWALVRYLVCGLAVGAAFGLALPDFRGTLLAALTGAVVAASGSAGPSGISRRVALISAALALVLTVVAFATGDHPVWAAIAMAAVALLTSLAAAAGPLGGLLGFLGSLAYFLVATMARVANCSSSSRCAGWRHTSRSGASAACSSSSSARPCAVDTSRTR